LGRDYAGVFAGSNWFARDVIDNTENLPILLAENNVQFELPEQYFVFFAHQGYNAAWFDLPKENDNPAIWLFSEARDSNNQLIRSNQTFIDFLLNDMKVTASALKTLYEDSGKPKNKSFLDSIFNFFSRR
jgi:hypothetical protein